MKRKALITTSVAVALVAAVGIGSTLAYFTDRDDQTNVLTFGHVDITLEEPDFEEDSDGTFEITNLTPGGTYTKDPTIIVAEDSEDAFLRAKIEYQNISPEKAGELEELIAFDYDIENDEKVPLWIKGDDGYYYYQGVAEAGDEVLFFDEVTIPYFWKNEVAGKSFKIKVTAEAIQADNTAMADELLDEDGDLIAPITSWYTPDGETIKAQTYKAKTTANDVE